MQVSNFGNDIILAEQCRQDVDKFCSSEEAGNGRVHACLRSHRSELTPGCAAEELKLEIEESSNFELRTSLKQVSFHCVAISVPVPSSNATAVRSSH
jgi:golgi apparatus protein 1